MSEHNFLETVLNRKRVEVERLRSIGLRRLKQDAEAARPALDFKKPFSDGSSPVPIIAEIKRFAPSGNRFANHAQIDNIATSYQLNGAAAISIVTDEHFFGCGVGDLITIRSSVAIPILRKDFIITVEQIYEARAAGADAVLLIVACTGDERLRALHQTTLQLGMTPLVEVHDEGEIKRALRIGPQLIGINNRDLNTLRVDLGVSERLRKMIPPEIIVVAESGVNTSDDIQRLLNAGVDGFLIGTALLKDSDPGRMLRSFVKRRY
ncbi:MAG: indole-3-glycerol phosphate synthase TrpC [Desulfomonilaceae bacterium]